MPTADSDLDLIINAPEHQLRAVLKLICTDDVTGKVQRRVREFLSAIAEFDKEPNRERKRKAYDGNDVEEPETKRKRLIEESHVCVQCKEVYLESDNPKKSCWHHPGKFDEEAAGSSVDVDTVYRYNGEKR